MELSRLHYSALRHLFDEDVPEVDRLVFFDGSAASTHIILAIVALQTKLAIEMEALRKYGSGGVCGACQEGALPPLRPPPYFWIKETRIGWSA